MTVAIAKQPGTNAVEIANQVIEKELEDGGLIVSAAVTLFIIPTVYTAVERFRSRRKPSSTSASAWRPCLRGCSKG